MGHDEWSVPSGGGFFFIKNMWFIFFIKNESIFCSFGFQKMIAFMCLSLIVKCVSEMFNVLLYIVLKTTDKDIRIHINVIVVCGVAV